MLNLLGESKTRLGHLQRPSVITSWTQVLCQAQEGVGFGRRLTNLAGGLEGLLTKVEGLGEAGRGGNHNPSFIPPAFA